MFVVENCSPWAVSLAQEVDFTHKFYIKSYFITLQLYFVISLISDFTY